jgi:rhodanese-related sulfurtransferase
MDTGSILRITCEELKISLEAPEKVVLIDTRNNSTYNAEHIPGAVNVYYDPSGSPAEREMMLMTLPGDCLLIFYCD